MTGILEWIVNEASRGLDEGDVREALTAIKWKVKDALRAAPRSPSALADSFPEVNLSNYTDDDVSALNNWGFEVVDAPRRGAEPQ